MYHGLHADQGARGRYDAVYSVHPDAFARQLDWLQAQGYRTRALGGDADASAGTDAAHKPVVITFDDGDISNIEVALPMLQARAMIAMFFITSDFIGQPGMLSAADVRSLADAGMGIGSHGRSHAFLEDLDTDALHAELHESRTRLQEIGGREVTAIALPGGRGGERERRVAWALGYRSLSGSVPGPNRAARDDGWLQRLPVTRTLALEDFAALVQWRGLQPRLARARFLALALPKRVLGNRRYERLRTRLL